MKGLILFIAIIVALYYLLRYLRQREVEAFLDADMGDFQSFAITQQEEVEQPDPLLARAEVYAAQNPEISLIKPAREDVEHENELQPQLQVVPDPISFELKDATFDEVTRNLLVQIVSILPAETIVLASVPLSDFVRSDAADASYRLTSQRVSAVICQAADLAVLCGIQLKESGQAAQADFIRSVFKNTGIPLLEFPLSHDISALEIQEQLIPALASRDDPACPKCGGSMNIKTAVKGKNAGVSFWVCQSFPGCRGATRIQ